MNKPSIRTCVKTPAYPASTTRRRRRHSGRGRVPQPFVLQKTVPCQNERCETSSPAYLLISTAAKPHNGTKRCWKRCLNTHSTKHTVYHGMPVIWALPSSWGYMLKNCKQRWVWHYCPITNQTHPVTTTRSEQWMLQVPACLLPYHRDMEQL